MARVINPLPKTDKPTSPTVCPANSSRSLTPKVQDYEALGQKNVDSRASGKYPGTLFRGGDVVVFSTFLVLNSPGTAFRDTCHGRSGKTQVGNERTLSHSTLLQSGVPDQLIRGNYLPWNGNPDKIHPVGKVWNNPIFPRHYRFGIYALTI